MKPTLLKFLSFLLVLTFMASCTPAAQPVELEQAEEPAATAPAKPTASPDLDATIDAAVAATNAAEEAMEAAIEEAVQATVAAFPTSTPVPIEEISEVEMAEAVETSAQGAADAVDEVSAATTAYAADGVITDEEAEALALMMDYAYAEIETALWLADQYYYIYGELAEETLEMLYLVEDELMWLLEYANEYEAVLNQMLQLLEQGDEVAAEIIGQLEESVEKFESTIPTVQEQVQGWLDALLVELDTRPDLYLGIEPTEVFQTRREALDQARDYAKSVRDALVDGAISLEEMTQIAQLGANAAASLNTAGGPELKDFANTITSLTTQLAIGDLPQANLSLNEFELNLPSRP